MDLMKKLLVLGLIVGLKPACGGGGGNGGGASGPGVSFPTLPAVVSPAPAKGQNLTSSTFTPTPLDASAATATINATSARTDAQVQSDLAAAIAATAGGRITFTVTGGVPRTVVITSPIAINTTTAFTLDGGNSGGNNLIVLSGGGTSAIFQLGINTNVTIQQVDFMDARAAQDGAALDAPSPINGLTVTNCNFTNCQTLTAGPDHGGGAVRAWNSAGTTLSGCTFTQCAGSNGGAVNSLGSPLTIVECNFIQNAAFGTGGGADAGPSGQGGIGGAVYVDNVSNGPAPFRLAISGCLFNANVANAQAGAVFGFMDPSKNSTTDIDATTFCGNEVLDPNNAGGGALYSLNWTLNLTNSTFSTNSSAAGGGGVRCDNSTTNITNCTFQGNSAIAGLGGAIARFTGSSTQLTLQNVTVAQNSAGAFAGGIYWSGGAGTSATANGCIFSSNTGTNNFQGWQTNVSLNGAGNLQWPSITGPTGVPISSTGTTLGNPSLGALQNNGGPTFTLAIPNTSPAVSLATGAGTVPAQDQTGTTRATPDAGAYGSR